MKRWEAKLNHGAWALTAATGVAYGVLKYFVPAADPDSRAGSPWQPLFLAGHVLLAPLAVFALGLIFRRHALARWRNGQREGRPSGRILFFAAIPLVVSGYVVQVVTGSGIRRWTGWGHAALGAIFAAAYLFHPREAAGRSDANPREGDAAGDEEPAPPTVR
jgi:hypothetical protein